MGFQQIQAPTLRELFVDQVIGMIFSGELKVGDRLPSERELSEQMHISRSMVHTGLEDLERMGFVRMEPRRGNYIEDYARHGNFETLMALGKYGGQFDHAIESSLVEARDAIEGGAMILLGERGRPADIDQLRAITDGLRASVAAGEGNAAYAQWMRKFDTTITELSGNLIFVAHEQPCGRERRALGAVRDLLGAGDGHRAGDAHHRHARRGPRPRRCAVYREYLSLLL